MNFATIIQNEDKTYSIGFSENFYKIFVQYYTKESYNNILYRIFGLLPQDYYHMIGTYYNAKFKPSPHIKSFVYTLFDKKSDAINFANEIDRRLTFLINKEESANKT